MMKILHWIIFIVFFPVLTYAQQLVHLEIIGNKVFEEKDYLSWCNLTAKEKYSSALIDSVKERISLKLSERGYFFPSIKNISVENPGDTLKPAVIKMEISEGTPAYINRISVIGDSLNADRVHKEFEFLEDRLFLKSSVEQSISSLLDFYEETGHPFARILIKSISLSTDSANNKVNADIQIEVEKYRVSRIDKIEVTGNEKTKEYVILRDSRINPGSNYSQKEIDEIPERLNKLLFFEPVENPSYYVNSEKEGVLLIHVKEKVTNNFDGVIGYVPGNETDKNSKGYITGLVNISLRNLFGTGRASAIKWQQINRHTQELDIKYLEPWLFGFPFNINLELFQIKQDTTYIQRQLEAAIEYLASSTVSASFVFSSTSVVPSLRERPVFTVYNSSTVSTGVNLKIDTRDDFYSPTEGVYFSNSYTFNRKKINGPVEYLIPGQKLNINYQKFEMDFAYYRQIFKRNVLAVAVHGREMKGSNFEVSDLYKLGGANTLRGYREQQFLGNRLLWSNLESRLLLARRTYAFAFLDTGYYLRQADEANAIGKLDGIKYGYGLGLNVETGLGVLNVSYALANGDSFGDGKIHFGLVSEF